MKTVIVICTLILLGGQAGTAYWVAKAVESNAPSDYATESRQAGHSEVLNGMETQLEKIASNTEDLQDSLDEMAPASYHHRVQRHTEQLQRMQRDSQQAIK